MDRKDSFPGKIEIHGRGAGEITEETLERRARELALIEGRQHARPTEEDYEQARRELLGESTPDVTTEDDESLGAISRDLSEPPSLSGRHVDTSPDSSDEETVLERLVVDGVEEAQHEQMLEARREESRQ